MALGAACLKDGVTALNKFSRLLYGLMRKCFSNTKIYRVQDNNRGALARKLMNNYGTVNPVASVTCRASRLEGALRKTERHKAA